MSSNSCLHVWEIIHTIESDERCVRLQECSLCKSKRTTDAMSSIVQSWNRTYDGWPAFGDRFVERTPLDKMADISTYRISHVAAFIDSAIRVLYNSDKGLFNVIFGEENGPYLWNKFTGHFDANEGSFICYLDWSNQQKLAKYVISYSKENDSRLNQ